MHVHICFLVGSLLQADPEVILKGAKGGGRQKRLGEANTLRRKANLKNYF